MVETGSVRPWFPVAATTPPTPQVVQLPLTQTYPQHAPPHPYIVGAAHHMYPPHPYAPGYPQAQYPPHQPNFSMPPPGYPPQGFQHHFTSPPPPQYIVR